MLPLCRLERLEVEFSIVPSPAPSAATLSALVELPVILEEVSVIIYMVRKKDCDPKSVSIFSMLLLDTDMLIKSGQIVLLIPLSEYYLLETTC